MRKQEITEYCRDHPEKDPAEKDFPLACGEKQQCQKDHEENECASQIPGDDQDPHVDHRCGCEESQMLKAVLLTQGACHKEKEQYFDKFTRLKSQTCDRETDFGPVRDRSEKQHSRERCDSRQTVEISSLAQRIKPASEEREQQHEQHSPECDQKLLLRLGVVDPGYDHKSYAQHHHDIVHHQHIGALIQTPV